MTLSPHHYRNKIKNANQLIEKINQIISGVQKEGIMPVIFNSQQPIKPIAFEGEIDSIYRDCLKLVGELDMCINGLLNNSTLIKEYTGKRNEVLHLAEELKRTYYKED